MRFVLAFAMCLPLLSQPRFEVATLKLAPPPEGDSININLGRFQNGRLTMNNVTLSDMMKYAYELVADAQLTAPDWNPQPRFDVEAKTESGTSPDQLHQMMQALLAERLHLALRREMKTLPHLALVPGRGGAKLMIAKDLQALAAGPQIRGKINHPAMPMSLLASLLSRFERQTVVDLTGLKGSYEVKLEWAPDNMGAIDPNAPPPDRPGLFAAVSEQLGLRLESRRAPLEVVIVQSASQVPEAN